MTTEQLLNLAMLRSNSTSSQLCLADAFSLLEKGREHDARRRALASLKHSVGILSSEFQAAAEAVR